MRRRFREEITCDVCGAEKEYLIHFLLWCPGYSEQRRKSVKLQQPYIQEEEEIVARYLFENKDIEEAKREITNFWKIREGIRKEKERNRKVTWKIGQTQTQTAEHIGVAMPRPNSRPNN